eukprot:GFYU01006438.1.p1 GENE.GFYU01006438.1~~GFYU01006438.1.p1  ORF type:complete len:1605 (-),score=614.63 GFYU01006438.1:18-4832(-)
MNEQGEHTSDFTFKGDAGDTASSAHDATTDNTAAHAAPPEHPHSHHQYHGVSGSQRKSALARLNSKGHVAPRPVSYPGARASDVATGPPPPGLSRSKSRQDRLDSTETHVRVAVRIRPLVPSEKLENVRECVSAYPDHNQIVFANKRSFTFDYAFGQQVGQEDIYNKSVIELVDGFEQGYNACVLAYGQTGAGKTHSMGSGLGGNYADVELGIIPRVIDRIFNFIEDIQESRETLLRVSYLEIYNEEVKDLLDTNTNNPKTIFVRENASGDIAVSGLSEEIVNSREEMLRCLERGSVSRTTGATLMNQLSSRSHSIFTIVLEQKVTGTDGSTSDGRHVSEYLSSKFHLVDLAGSERAKKTGNAGVRFRESVTINSGLLALGNVISALGDEKKRGQHVPYRQSKLTRLLQDSLGGNSRTLMLACVSPADVSFDETLNTLKYANRARNIRNKPVVNREQEDNNTTQLAQLQNEIQSLQEQLASQQTQSHASFSSVMRSSTDAMQLAELKRKANLNADTEKENDGLRHKNKQLEDDNNTLRLEVQQKTAEISTLSQELLETRTARDTLEIQLADANDTIKYMSESADQFKKANSMRESLNAKLQHIMSDIQLQKQRTPRRSAQQLPVTPTMRPVSAPAQRGDDSVVDADTDTSMRDMEAEAETTRRELESSHGRIEQITDNLKTAGSRLRKRPTADQRDVVQKHLSTIKSLEEQLFGMEERYTKAKNELEEAKADLARDERIFAEKMKEVKSLTKQNKKLLLHNAATEHKYKTASEELMSVQAQVNDLTAELEHSRQEASAARAKMATPPNVNALPPPPAAASAMPRRPQTTDGTPVVVPPHISPAKIVRSERSSSQLIAQQIEQEEDEVRYGGSFLDDTSHTITQGTDTEADAGCGTDGDAAGGDGEHITNVLAENIAALEAEKKRLIQENQQAQKEKDEIEQQAKAQLQDYQVGQNRVSSALRDLNINIKLKEELIRELVKNEKQATTVAERYEKRLQEMSSEVSNKQHEIDRLNAEVLQMESRGESTDDARQEYERKIKTLGHQLLESKKKLKEQERLARIKQQDDRKIYNLEAELEKMKAQEKKLQQKMKDDIDHHELMKNTRSKEIIALKKTLEDDQKRIRELESENQRQKMILTRKQDELAVAQRKLKKQDSVYNTIVPPDGAKEKEKDAKEKEKKKKSVEEFEKKKAWLDEEIERHLAAKDHTEKLEKELNLREEKIQEREMYLEKRNKLELQKIRSGEVVRDSIVNLEGTITQISRELKQKETELETKNTSSQDDDMDGMSMLRETIQKLHSKRRQACVQKAEFEEKSRTQEYLSPQEEEELKMLDEQIDNLDEEIEYKSEAITETEKAVKTYMDATAEGEEHQMISENEAKYILKKYFEKVVEMKQKEKKSQRIITEHEMKMSELHQTLEELQNSLRVTEIEYDRKSTKVQKEYELKIQDLYKQLESATRPPSEGPADEGSKEKALLERDEHIAILEKDNFYYKQTNRDLKRKLREVVAANESDRHAMEKERSRSTRLGDVNKSLLDELHNLKSYVQKHDGMSSVRISASQVRPMTQEDVQKRLSTPASSSRPASATVAPSDRHSTTPPGGAAAPPSE